MIALIVMSMVLIGALCVLAYRLAVYALPVMLGIEIARFAYQLVLVSLDSSQACWPMASSRYCTFRSDLQRPALPSD